MDNIADCKGCILDIGFCVVDEFSKGVVLFGVLVALEFGVIRLFKMLETASLFTKCVLSGWG